MSPIIQTYHYNKLNSTISNQNLEIEKLKRELERQKKEILILETDSEQILKDYEVLTNEYNE